MSIIFTVVSRVMRKKKHENKRTKQGLERNGEKGKVPYKPKHVYRKKPILNVRWEKD